jgi:hypothetical protein
MIGSSSGLEFGEAKLDPVAVERGRAPLRCLEGQTVVLGGELGLAQMIETDRQVEQVVRVVRFGGHGIEIDLLCLGPAVLA